MDRLEKLVGMELDDVIGDKCFSVTDGKYFKIEEGPYEGIVLESEDKVDFGFDDDDAYMGHKIIRAFYSEEGGIEDLNKSLCKEAQISIIDHQQFKLMYADDGSKFERFVASIKSVEQLSNGYKISLDNEKVVCCYFNGECTINNKHANHIDSKSGHNRLVIDNNTIIVEKLILTAKAVMIDKLPISFKGLCVNVKDGSGSIHTAHKLKIMQNFHLDNLEWTLTSRNKIHGIYIKPLYKIFGRAIKFSANDLKLYQLLQLKNKVSVQVYVAENY